jgi:hypothetical protein
LFKGALMMTMRPHLFLPVLFGQTYQRKTLNLFGASIIAYWPLWEPSGSVANDISGNARNGSYTGVALGQTGIGDGHTAPLFDGTADFVNVYSAGLAGAFSGVAGSLMTWGKVSGAGVWTDSTARYLLRLAADGNNQITLEKRSLNNTLRALYTANATVKGTSPVFSGLTWFHFAITWDKNAGADGQVLVFLNGAQSGATQTGLGVWAGALAAATTVIGALDLLPSNGWSGYLAHVLLLNRAATPAEIASVYKV